MKSGWGLQAMGKGWETCQILTSGQSSRENKKRLTTF